MKKQIALQLIEGDWALTAGGEQVGVWTDLTDALTAAMDAAGDVSGGPRFALVFIEGEETVDFRIIDPGAIEFDRQPPWPFMFTKDRTQGHAGSTLVGVIESGGRVAGTDGLHFEGRFDSLSDNEAAAEAVRLLETGMMGTWSPDIGKGKGELQCTEMGENDVCMSFVEHLQSGVFIGGTMVPFQALDSAKITLLDEPGSEEEPADSEPAIAAGGTVESTAVTVGESEFFIPDENGNNAVSPGQIIATLLDVASTRSTAETPWAPPLEYFEMAESEELHPLVIDGDRVYGFLAAWNVCHTGVRDRCVLAPRSNLDYGAFHVGTVVTAEGETIRVGRLTIGTGHAGLSLRESEARSHYDNTGAAWALVRAVDGERGIWVSGAVLPDVDEMTIHRARACALSGDWRQVAGGLELVAALSVPVPGFPLVASAEVPEAVSVRAAFDDNTCTALVAAGAWGVERHRGDPRLLSLQEEVAELRAWRALVDPIIELLHPSAIHELAQLVKPEEPPLEYRDISPDQRKQMAKDGRAMPDGSFPIATVDDLKNAIQAVGRANPGDRPKVKAHIKKRAKALGKSDLIPDNWK
jgi:hypothetical protein